MTPRPAALVLGPLIGALVAVACTASRPADAATGSPVPTCVYTAAQVQAGMRAVPGWVSADNGTSAPLDSGRWLFAFGDGMHLVDGELRFIRNTLVVLDCQANGQLVQHGIEVIPNREGLLNWGGPMLWDAGRLVMLSARVTTNRPGCDGEFCWDHSGTDAVTFATPAGGMPSVAAQVPVADGGTRGIGWTAGLERGPDGFAYIYGTVQDDNPFTMGHDLYVARASAGNLADVSAWRYFDGGGWQADQEQVQSVLRDGPEASFSVQYRANRWEGYTKRHGRYSDYGGRFISASPIGPWRWEQLIAVEDTDTQGTYLFLGHKLRLGAGGVLVSWSKNAKVPTDEWLQSIREHPELWQNEYRRVPGTLPSALVHPSLRRWR